MKELPKKKVEKYFFLKKENYNKIRRTFVCYYIRYLQKEAYPGKFIDYGFQNLNVFIIFTFTFLWGATFEIIDTIKNANYLNICAESVLQSNTKCLSKFAKKKILEEKFCRKFSSLTCIKTCILSNLTGFLGRNLLWVIQLNLLNIAIDLFFKNVDSCSILFIFIFYINT